nr:expressed protein [Hymenolepis microstoma]
MFGEASPGGEMGIQHCHVYGKGERKKLTYLIPPLLPTECLYQREIAILVGDWEEELTSTCLAADCDLRTCGSNCHANSSALKGGEMVVVQTLAV